MGEGVEKGGMGWVATRCVSAKLIATNMAGTRKPSQVSYSHRVDKHAGS